LIPIPVTPDQVAAFGLIFMRVTTFLFLLPFYGSANVPAIIKAFLSLLISVALFGTVKVNPGLFPDSTWALVHMMAAEALIGALIALFVRMFFAGIQIGGQLIGFQMGLAIVNVIDPQSGTQSSIVAQFGYLVALLVFLTADGHHAFMVALAKSFQILPVGGFGLKKLMVGHMLEMSARMFVLAVKIAAPAMAALLLTQAAMGVVAKTVPQMNILAVGFPVTIGVGLFMLGLVLLLVGHYTTGFFADLQVYALRLLRAM
jgi:flagellar biosynthetic protein FliR